MIYSHILRDIEMLHVLLNRIDCPIFCVKRHLREKDTHTHTHTHTEREREREE